MLPCKSWEGAGVLVSTDGTLAGEKAAEARLEEGYPSKEDVGKNTDRE